jgi:NAD(P)H dehydrogenase (quinone)
MNILYINGHPYKKSFHGAIQKSYVSGIDRSKHTVKVLELGELSFDPVLRGGYSEIMPEDPEVTKSQDLVMWADHLVFAYPMWWGMMPSLMSGWIARVFVPRKMYHITGLISAERNLKGKTGDIIITSRLPRLLWWTGANASPRVVAMNLFFWTGIKHKKTLIIDLISLKWDTEERRKRFLRKVKRRGAALK